ncbi:type II toxin-antitoxin system HipA family toxin [Massilia oculi]|uniref:type II toxin-antitoxin system HipA family toxin n=1 Tax=Massilia oculi TaxID=945844 RepID=UPI0028B1B19D|nr:type II toxin-antitoxin system HipA family toxin [Massilia oculi]
MAKPALPPTLSVFGPEGQIGSLYPGDPLGFAYCQAWLEHPLRSSLHAGIPLQPGRSQSRYVTAFFENLLPEGDQRKLITMREHVSSVYGLLAKVGGESASSVVLLPEGEQPHEPVYQTLTWQQVNALVHNDGKQAKELADIEREARGLPEPRMSISGAQHKLLLYIAADGTPRRPMGSSPSTHILKPDIVRTDIRVFASAANETIMMMLAHRCGLPVAAVSYEPVTRSCLVARYDRMPLENGQLRRIWQADFCQLLGIPSTIKYEHDGGPGFKDCFDLLGESVHPAPDRRNLLRWLFFNLYTGNNDSHAKNLSMIASGTGMRLAPFYDLMATRVYSGLGSDFAFRIGGESNPGKLGTDHLLALADQLGVKPAYLRKLGADMATDILAALPLATADVLPVLAPGERVMAQRIADKVGSLTKKLRTNMLGASH